LIDQVHEIGSQSSIHIRLSTPLTAEDYQSEIQGSGDLIGEKLGVTISWFSY
jgi:hypothetical protein